MSTQTVPSSSSLSSSPVPPSSPSRTSRLRGLSYLRNYTHHTSQSHHNQSATLTSSPPARSPARADSRSQVDAILTGQAARSNSSRRKTPTRTNETDEHSNTPGSHGTTSGWIPTVGGRNGLIRTGPRPRTTSTPTPAVDMSSNSEPAGCSHSDRAVSSSRRRSGRTRESAEQGLVPTYSDAAREFATLDGIPAVDANPASRSPPGPEISPPQGDVESPRPTESTPAGTSTSTQMPSIRFIPHQDPRAPRPSLVFPPVARTLPSGTSVIRVGRYSERDLDPSANPNALSSAPVGFKSKVVSRRHCEFWCSSGQWYIKDVKSSSGTFLNHIRLSQPNTESRPWPVNDGDVVQLGIDFKGGEEMIFRCVKIRVELNRGWQKALNSFNTNTHKRLRNLASRNPDKNPNDAASTHSSECSICLFSIAPCQSLFVAPCSHVWHYKCIRPILNGPTWPQFLCPNCRAIADLEAEVDEPEDWEEDVEQGQGSDTSMRQTPEPHADTAARQDPHGEASGTLENIMSTLAVARADSVELPEQMDREAQPTSVAHESLPASSLASRKGASVVPLNLTQASHSSATGSVVREGPSPDSEAHADNVPDRTSSEGSPPRRDGNRDTVGTEGPMTPRNDAGPFVFDGSAGRGSGHSLLPDLSGTASAENGSQSDSLD